MWCDSTVYFEFLLCVCRYLKGVKQGEKIVIDAETLKCGRSLAFLNVDIRKKEDDTLVAQGKHTKHVGS